METTHLYLVITSVIFAVVSVCIASLEKTESQMAAVVKEQAYQLFLHAEKQEWIGTEKMSFVADKLIELVPSKTLIKVIGEDRIKDWLQGLYDEAKEFLASK